MSPVLKALCFSFRRALMSVVIQGLLLWKQVPIRAETTLSTNKLMFSVMQCVSPSIIVTRCEPGCDQICQVEEGLWSCTLF